MELLVEQADRMAILIEIEVGGVLNVLLFRVSDGAEDLDKQSSDEHGNGATSSVWNCLREYM